MSRMSTWRIAIREASRLAFTSVRLAHPNEHFYFFGLTTTEEGLRPGPTASSHECLARICQQQKCAPEELRWSEADSPHNLHGDEHFHEVERLFLEHGDKYRTMERTGFLASVREVFAAIPYAVEVTRRYAAMEGALRDLDAEGFFGVGAERHAVVINVLAPGDEDEPETLKRAATLNPPESLTQLRKDWGGLEQEK